MRPGQRQEGRHGAAEAAATPDIPEATRDAARRAPWHSIGVVDPEWTEERTPPEWAVPAQWQPDASGTVVDHPASPEYRPSAQVLSRPEPTDATARRATTGDGPVDEALAGPVEAESTVVCGQVGEPLTAVGQDGVPSVLPFTSPAHAFTFAALRRDSPPASERTDPFTGRFQHPDEGRRGGRGPAARLGGQSSRFRTRAGRRRDARSGNRGEEEPRHLFQYAVPALRPHRREELHDA